MLNSSTHFESNGLLLTFAFTMEQIYLDNAATTPMDLMVIDVMLPYLTEHFGNPSSSHAIGRHNKAAIIQARKSISSLLHCTPGEIIFTGGGTEADNIAIRGCVKFLGTEVIITSQAEHHAVIHTAEDLKNEKNITLEYAQIDSLGRASVASVQELLKKHQGKNILVSLMHGNNELGTLNNIDAIGKLCQEYNAYFHSDTVQTMGHFPFDLSKLNIDFITCSAHKLHGPKGVGFLYINKRIKGFGALQTGGSQERDLRGGTENVSGIAGLAKALEISTLNQQHNHQHIFGLKTYMKNRLQEIVPDIQFNGDIRDGHSLYTVLNVSFPAPHRDTFLFQLDMMGIAASGGSACASGSNKGSHVLSAIQTSTERNHVRFSFSRFNTINEIDKALAVIQKLEAENHQ
jgi:cysteine desulfurase